MADGYFNDARFDFVTVPEKRWWGGTKSKTYMVLREPLVYTYSHDGETYRLTVEAGYPSDGASIPSGAIWLSDKLWFTDKIESFGIHWPATFFHDRIWDDENPLPESFCQRLDKVTGEWVNMPNNKPNGKKVWDFKASNKLFARQLGELGVGKGTRRAMFWSVSTVGLFNYRF